MKKLNLAIIGQGRSGKDIHGRYYISDENKYFNVKYVVDMDERRRKISAERYPGCEVFADYKELLDKKDIDIVVNSTYSEMHYPITKDLLLHGFNVLCEKPVARNRYECEELMKIAKDNGLVLAGFHQSLYSPFFQDALRIMKEKVIGDIIQVEIHENRFARRWDWQTLQKHMAGGSYNTGPHPFGWALGFLDFDPAVRVEFSKLVCSPMSSGDSDDYSKLILSAPNKPVIDVEVVSQDPFNDFYIKLLGTRGCYKCTEGTYQYKYFLEEENPKKPVQEEFLQGEDGRPLYCSEKLITHEEQGEFNSESTNVATFYEELYFKITEGKEMYASMDKVSLVCNIMERIYANNPMPLKF